jgi:uncharacterized protein DUF1329
MNNSASVARCTALLRNLAKPLECGSGFVLFSFARVGYREGWLRLRIQRSCEPVGAGKLIIGLVALLTAGFCFAGVVNAHLALSAEIQPGTIITDQNWQQYRPFMSDGLIALFEGTHFWHMPKDLRVEVGPTTSIPLPKKYLEDTARYTSQVKLTPTADGGYVPAGYVAGIPFPHPLEGDPALTGQRIFWDSYYRYQPRVQAASTFTYTLDAFGNSTQSSEVKTVLSQLAFLSEVDFPNTITGADGYYFVKYDEQISPELGKYTTILDLAPADPTKLDELYEYIPTLRRSLRLSQAARCAPVFGSDYLIDDENDGPPGLPQLFQIEYMGQKKILALEHANPASFDTPGGSRLLSDDYYYAGSIGFVPFPKPSMGKWELRDTYVLSLRRLPSAAKGYCYSRRVMYVDEENYFGAGELDLYDPAGKLFKEQMVLSYPLPIPKSGGEVAELASGPSVGFLVNFIDKHVTASVGLRPCVNSNCEKDGYLDIRRYASPEALMKIVR